jgi:hypothetical protein
MFGKGLSINPFAYVLFSVTDVKTLTESLGLVVRLISGVMLFGISAFCVFGFLASFEPGVGMMWKVGYGLLGCFCLTGVVWLLVRRRNNTLAPGSRTGRIIIACAALFFLAVSLLFLHAKLQ